MIRTIFVIFWTIPLTVFFAVLAILTSFISRSGNTPHRIARIWARCLLFVSGINVSVKGIQNISPPKPYIYMSNHLSNFDIPVLLACLPVQFRWLAKAELFKIPIFGYAMQRAGYISINRSDRKSAFKSLDQAARKVKNGTSIMIFPEGTRSLEQAIQPFKKGGFVLAVDSGVPIVPIIINGTWKIMSKNRILIQSGDVVLNIAEPIATSVYDRRSKDDLMKKVRQVIIESFETTEKDSLLC
jgi:1-acyl-sn-glycerol-3-phosphate acyltransferase